MALGKALVSLALLVSWATAEDVVTDDLSPDGGTHGKEGVQADPGYYFNKGGGYGSQGGYGSHGGYGTHGAPGGHGGYGGDHGGYRKKTSYHRKTGSYFNQGSRGCGKLSAPMHSTVTCTSWICVATCMDHYVFPSGETTLTLHCTDGRWTAEGLVTDAIPKCSPSCVPQCQNGGVCISPNVCQCPTTFFGPYCQYEKKPCYDFPATPMNSRKVCTSDTCTIACAEGFTFHDGSSVATITCKDGEWKPARKEWLTIPDCQPVCSPPCQNGGMCYGHNSCQCPQEFRGSQCQFSKDVCDVRKLAFNGNYNCSGDETTWNCALQCPVGMKFSSPSVPLYTCLYEEGVFNPPAAPVCIFEAGNDAEILSYIFSGTSPPDIEHEIIVHESNKTSKYLSKRPNSQSKKTVLIQKKKPTSGTCITWRRDHFKTFDGKILSFKSDCVYTLASNDDNAFHVQTPVIRDSSCDNSIDICTYLTIFMNDKEYKLMRNDDGKPAIKDGTNIIPVPTQVAGMKIDLGPKSVKATLQAVGVTVIWDMKDFVEVKVSEANWNKTTGLCGRMDGYEDNELSSTHSSLEEYVSSSQVLTTGEICQEKILHSPPCTDTALQQTAEEFCSALLHNAKFKSCHDVVSVKQFYEVCMWDYCSCESTGSKECSCETMSMYAKECARNGVKLPSWRDENLCGITCTGGRMYSQCGSETPCGGAERDSLCEEGCFCPTGTYVHNNTCVPLSSCPCSLRGKEFSPGTSIPKDCNTCTCLSGTWSCTEIECGAQCEAVGDPHYKTFDKRTYDFMGKCSYYLLKMDNYSVEAENIPCDGAISENMGFVVPTQSGMPSCTKAVTINMKGTVLKLKQGKEVTVNGEEVTLPVSLKHAYVSRASSIFVLVDLDDGVEVWWDGASSVYINAPPHLKGKTKGLCGTFTGNQKDDFLTPEGDIEQDAVSFANKWKTKESCDNEVSEEKHPCELNIQNKAAAEKICSKITSSLFLDCHFYVDPITHYQNCLYDVCSCSKKRSECFCPIISAYAKECAKQGVPIDWRSSVRECGLKCPRGQIYETCGKGCSRSCEDISRQQKCDKLCLEGCNCPPGFTLDQKGTCIPIAKCPCILNGLQYPAGHAEIRPASKGLELCTCTNALWECHSANSEELKKYPNNSLEEVACSATKNQVYSHCEPPEPVSCQNMHSLSAGVTPAICYGGCVCKKGYVLDSLTKECVKPEECPCHHGGHSYSDGAQIQEDCNTCVCNMGKWTCTDHTCPGVCTAWGDSHFKTFDDKLFDFQGTCEYILAKGAASQADCFSVSLELASCGSSGVSCSKSMTVTVGKKENQESVMFADGIAHPSNSTLKRISVREAGLFLFADIIDLKIVVQWDKGSKVSVRADPQWKGKVRGLCGNYNGDNSDDFETPSGGIEVSTQLFGDSWNLHDYCPISEPIKDACEIYPNRKAWSIEKCSVLKSDLFKPCHSEVPLDFYLEKCIFDSCACDQGGDCECLCTAIAAYAQECNAKGVAIKWRRQDFCPIQCDETCASYSPCVSTCPPETCDNYLDIKTLSKMCNQDSCVEGCKIKPCPNGEIFSNSSLVECVPVALCKPVCMTINGIDYYEGDLIEEDSCHSCYCSRNSKSCKGLPCTTTTAPSTEKSTTLIVESTTVIQHDSDVCITGWTEWINNNPLLEDGKYHETDSEPLPSSNKTLNAVGIKGPHCSAENMTDIRCRTVKTHMNFKETGEDVECSLENGLVCKGGCSDYEIKVFCQCGVNNSSSAMPIQETSTIKLTTKREEERGESPPEPRTHEEATVSPTTLPTTTVTFSTNITEAASTTTEKATTLEITSTTIKKITEGIVEIVPAVTTTTKTTTSEEFSSPETIPYSSTTSESVKIVPTITTTETTTSEQFTSPETILYSSTTSKSECNENEVWDECAIQCDQLCLYYEYTLYRSGVCLFGKPCTAGCRPKDKLKCNDGYKWRDENTCVKEEDCTCRSFTGEMIKPGKVVNESECKLCQCLNNHYSCDENACISTELTEATPTVLPSTEIIIISTVTPPAETCVDNRFVPLLSDMPQTSFKSSTPHQDPLYSPFNVKFNSIEGSWRPGVTDENQYLEIDLGEVDVIYGINVKGDILNNDYVTKYFVLYSLDNIAYSYVLLNGNPQLFNGPSYHLDPKFQVFSHPFEARFVRINPISWIGSPSMKIELLGCEFLTTAPSTVTTMLTSTAPTTTTPSPTTSAPVCTDKMSNHMNDAQIKVSSSIQEPFTAGILSVYRDEGWVPRTNDPNQWVQFDFLGERTLTGIMTSGSGFKLNQKDLMPSWVMSYYILYSHDEDEWNPIINEDGTRQIFHGNSDNTNIKTIMFRLPIRGRYVRIIPLEWHNKIALRVQMLGCYEPYPIITTTTQPTTTTLRDCNLCPGASTLSSECPCSPPLWWDGEQCTTRAQCPCFVGYIPYAIGTSFDNENCEQCVCVLNGITQCRKKECPSCEEGLRKVLTSSCACICKPCEDGTKLCPTSNVCINATNWCDGVADCADDEIDCETPPPTTPTTTTLITTTTTLIPITETPKECPPPPICGPGTKLEKIQEPEKKAPFWTPFGTKSKWSSYFKGNPRARKGYGARHKGARKSKGGHKGGHKGGFGHPSIPVVEAECGKYICSCVEQPPQCPPGSKLVVIKAEAEGQCDKFSCPVPPDKYCFVNGRTFTTFDGVEYKYDICDHIIARDRVNKEWEIREVKTCAFIGPCEKHLLIKYENHTIRLNTDQTIIFDGYAYTIPQMQKIGSQNEEFAIKQVNNKFTIFSSRLGFSIVWDSQANIKVVVPGTSIGEVDGLCGFLDDNPANDKQKPNGELAKTSVQFGDSWGESLDCETKACPAHVQKEAFEMCKAIREEPLIECGTAINLDKIHSQCVEAICLCSEQTNSTESCRCDAILKAVTDCQNALPHIDMTSWRVQNDCPVDCPPGLVYKDCFRRTCEPCCAELMTPDACPETNECFPGCYCPDGYVRSYDECVKPAECRDCICEGYGSSRFVTFDKLDYTYNGNCTHILAETLKNVPGPKFKVLLTNTQCEDNPGQSCAGKITILYKDHSVQAINSKNKKIEVKIDDKIEEVPLKNNWVTVTELLGKGINIYLPKIQLDLEVLEGTKNYKLKLPSHLYVNRTEGLCGICNTNTTDDLKMKDGNITDNINDFGQSWLLKDLPSVLEKEDSCVSENVTTECLPPPPENDKCLILMDEKLFGKCHAVIDPSIFVSNCHDALCHGITNVCRELEAYARECQAERICLKWRSENLCPFSCPAGLEYEPCGIGCTETCDNYELLATSPEKCQTPKAETCVCPSGKVVQNGTCIEKSRCTPCDTEGHYPGDEWKPDSCTLCNCTSKSVQCQRIQCPPKTTCELGYKNIVVPGTETDCCPQYTCAPKAENKTCPPTQMMKCGQDQILKTETDKNGCKDYVCVCKPKEECVDVKEEVAKLSTGGMEPGFVAEIDNSGCCPFVNKTCNPNTCPIKDCPEFQIPVKKGEGVCCPVYECEIPKDHCLYEFMNGGNEGKNMKALKNAGDVWKDGPCRTCECQTGSTVAHCTEQFCQTPPESDNYLYEAVNVNNKCCPIYKRTACKVGDKIYQVGETWPVENDVCKNGSCVIGSKGEVLKEDAVQACNKACKKGFSYVEPPVNSKDCCGECVPTACVVNGTIHSKDSVWHSLDNCTTYTCLIEDNQVQVVSSEETCPDIRDCAEKDIYVEGCCKKCNETLPPVNHSACAPEPVALNTTIRMVQIFDDEHGPCANNEPITEFKECRGICDSFTEFDWRTGQHESNCLCCQGKTFEDVKVTLSCADGSVITHEVPVPSVCQCLACVASSQVESAPQRFVASKKSKKGKTVKGKTSVKGKAPVV